MIHPSILSVSCAIKAKLQPEHGLRCGQEGPSRRQRHIQVWLYALANFNRVAISM
jgi:hypothetical protein